MFKFLAGFLTPFAVVGGIVGAFFFLMWPDWIGSWLFGWSFDVTIVVQCLWLLSVVGFIYGVEGMKK